MDKEDFELFVAKVWFVFMVFLLFVIFYVGISEFLEYIQ